MKKIQKISMPIICVATACNQRGILLMKFCITFRAMIFHFGTKLFSSYNAFRIHLGEHYLRLAYLHFSMKYRRLPL